MGKHVSELTLEELAAAGRAAGERAVTEAHAAGLSVTGALRDATGDLWLARRLPNGEVEWLDRISERSEPLAASNETILIERAFSRHGKLAG